MKPTLNPALPRERGCRLCRRLRWVVAGASLATLAAVLAWQAGAQASDGIPGAAPAASAPVRPAASPASELGPTALPPVAVAAPAGRTSVAIDDANVDQALLLRTVSLRAGRRGEVYRPLLLVRQAARVDAVRLTGELPPGLALGDDGTLRGVPTLVGLFQFQLEVVAGASPQAPARQRYALRILAPAPAHAAAAASGPASAARPSLKALSEDDSAAYVDVDKAVPASYMLTSIAAWVPTEETARPGSDAASAVVPPTSDGDAATDATVPVTAVEAARLPTIDQLRAELTPLLDIEYPTRPLFVQALQASHCDYYRAHLAELARDKSVDMTCPPPAPPAASSSPARSPGDPMTLSQFYQSLLPPRIEKEVVDAALKLHPLDDAAPLLLGADGCGCHIPVKDENVYGLFPFWLATKEVQTVDFSLFSHIGFMGAILQDDGSMVLAGGSSTPAIRFARIAAQHETAVDLVVYRRDWAALLRWPEAKRHETAIKAAHEALRQADLRFDDATSHWLKPLLMPGWKPDERVFAGLTIFFDDASAEKDQRANFKAFYQDFTDELILAMQRDGRSFHLNFVVPDVELGDEEGAYGFTQLTEYMEKAQPRPRDKNADKTTVDGYKGKTDISVFYLVTLGKPTSDSRLELRSRVDHTDAIHGHRRVAFLQGIVPLVFGTRMRDAKPMPDVRLQAINSDLAYMRWNFGGAGFWPAPVVVPGPSDPLHDKLASTYRPPDSLSNGLCEFACPNRLMLRLLFQSALLIEVALLVAYAWSCRLRRVGGRKLLLLTLLAGFVTIAIGAAVFTCDPLLAWPNKSSWVLGASLVLAGLWAVYKTLRPTMDPP